MILPPHLLEQVSREILLKEGIDPDAPRNKTWTGLRVRGAPSEKKWEFKARQLKEAFEKIENYAIVPIQNRGVNSLDGKGTRGT